MKCKFSVLGAVSFNDLAISIFKSAICSLTMSSWGLGLLKALYKAYKNSYTVKYARTL